MERIVTAWKESATLLLISRNLNFWLVSVYTLKQLLRQVVALWPLFLGLVGSLIISHAVFPGIAPVFSTMLLVCIIISIRPSIDRKSGAHYIKQCLKITWIIPVIFVIRYAAAPWMITDIIAPAYCVILALFAFDSSNDPRSWPRIIWRSLFFTFLNLPFILLVSGLFVMIQQAVMSLVNLIGIPMLTVFAGALILLLLQPLLICIITNFYTKKIHDDFDLYFLAQLNSKDAQ